MLNPLNHLKYRVEPHSVITQSGRMWAYSRWRPVGSEVKDTVVMIHSILFDKHLWDEIAAYFCAEHQIEVFAFDLPGHGDSCKNVADVSYDTIQQDIINIVETLRLPNFHYVGCSIGSEWGMRTSVSHPQRIKSLVLIGPSSLEPTLEDKQNFNLAISQWRSQGMTALADYMFSEPFFFDSSFLTSEAMRVKREQQRRRVLAMDPAALHITSLWANRSVVLDYSQIKHPVLLMCGADDEYFLPHAEHLYSLLPNAQMDLIPNAAHEGPIENPTRCIELMERFWRAL